MLSCEFLKIFKNTFFTEPLLEAATESSQIPLLPNLPKKEKRNEKKKNKKKKWSEKLMTVTAMKKLFISFTVIFIKKKSHFSCLFENRAAA